MAANELSVDRLAWRCPQEWIPWKDSTEIEPATTIVGQERAVEAIGFGLDMKGIGYNVFVTGLSGTGRLTTIKRFLSKLTGNDKAPDDVCFVFNFLNDEEPQVLFLNAGAGRRFRDGMDALVRELAEALPGILNSKDFRRRLDRAVEGFQKKEREILTTLEGDVRDAGFSLVQIQAGPVTRPEILPLVNEEPISIEELPGLVAEGKITKKQADKLEKLYGKFRDRLQDVFLKVSIIRRQAQSKIDEVRRKLVQPTFDEAVDQVASSVDDERVHVYLDQVREDLPEYMDLLAAEEEAPGTDQFMRWRVNLVVDNAETKGRPVKLETEPSYGNLFGTIERTVLPSGDSVTSFTKIKAGSLLEANGGFLVLSAEDLLMEGRSWAALKRALKYQRVRIQTMDSPMFGASGLKPSPVPLDVKVVVIGDRQLYDYLYQYDNDFSKIFKVLADFESTIDATAKRAADVLSVLTKVLTEEELLPMESSGMAAMLEHSVLYGRWRHRFSSRFSDLTDLLREAAFLAARENGKMISRRHVEGAQAAYRRRHCMSEDQTHEMMIDGVVFVETTGVAVGQLNGLAVYDLGHYRFGKPSRISARVGMGRQGVINIERQAGLSGPTHDKGIGILTGFLRGTFARNGPLTMACSVTFEQSYGGVDGDSASSTEIYAILSALSEIPLRQDIAVTGSVDQYGRVQAIGGVNEKVEGFFKVCLARGLTGDQGVMIPASNVDDLQLGNEIVEAVREGRFHVWSVTTIEDGLALLTGREVGALDGGGHWDSASILGICATRLREMARVMKNIGKSDDADQDKGVDGDEDSEYRDV